METDTLHPSEDLLRGIDVHDLLPQHEPFVMIGSLVHFDEKLTVTETSIDQENIFVDNNILSASGLIENIAQTCAIRIGYINKHILKKSIQIGVIGAIKNLEINKNPHAGQKLTTTVEVLEEVFGMILATATVRCEGNVIATTEIKIAIKERNAK